MDLENLQTALDNAREVYERLIVLRYRAYDELVHTTREMPLFSETEMPETESIESLVEVIEVVSAPEKEQPKVLETVQPEPTPVKAQEVTPITKATPIKINDQESIGDKLSKSAIPDLKKAIGLNQKFLFINTLFSGDALAYDEAVSTINSMNSFSDAQDKCSELRSKYKWNDEEPATEQFEDLIERRFL